MIELRITASDLQQLRRSLFSSDQEQCAVLFANRGNRTQNGTILLIRELEFPQSRDYLERGIDHAQLRPEFVARVAKKARSKDFSLVFVHTHPGELNPEFSRIDDLGETKLLKFLERREQHCIHAALVLSHGGVIARRLGHNQPIKLVSVGDRRIVEYNPFADDDSKFEVYDRQIRAFGIDGQLVLNDLRVAVVGLGGTGSIALQQIVHLGVGKLLLIDSDHIDSTNLNRVVGASANDIGKSKCLVACRYAKNFAPDAEVRSIEDDVTKDSVARELIDADLIICCTDSHGSRSVVQQVAYQYLIPCIDIGSIIKTKEGQISGIFGRVQMLGPDQACLWCSRLLRSDEIRRDMMDEAAKAADPYFSDKGVIAPAVISLNGTVVSLAVTSILGLVTSVPVCSRYVIYDALKSSLRSVSVTPERDCFICSRKGVVGLGDTQPLFARKG